MTDWDIFKLPNLIGNPPFNTTSLSTHCAPAQRCRTTISLLRLRRAIERRTEPLIRSTNGLNTTDIPCASRTPARIRRTKVHYAYTYSDASIEAYRFLEVTPFEKLVPSGLDVCLMYELFETINVSAVGVLRYELLDIITTAAIQKVMPSTANLQRRR